MLTTPQALYLPPCYQFHFCFLKTNNVITLTSDYIPNPKSFVTIFQLPNIPRDNFQIHWCTTESCSPLALPDKADFFSWFQEFSRLFNSRHPLEPVLASFFWEHSPCILVFFLASKAKKILVISASKPIKEVPRDFLKALIHFSTHGDNCMEAPTTSTSGTSGLAMAKGCTTGDSFIFSQFTRPHQSPTAHNPTLILQKYYPEHHYIHLPN